MKKKVSFSAACEIEKKIVREEKELEMNENESEDGVVEHSKDQELGSRKICQKFRAFRIGRAFESDNCSVAGRTSWLYGEKIRNGGRFVVLKGLVS